MWLVTLLTATMALPRPEVLAGEALPPRALARIGDHRFYHGPDITCAVLSPDGRRIASAAYDPTTDAEQDFYSRTIVLWDAATGERLREMRVAHREIRLLAFSPNGQQLAGDYQLSDEVSGVAVFEVKTGKLLRRLEGFKSWATSVQFSTDGKQVQVSEWRGPVSAWDPATGKQLHIWKSPPDEPAVGDDKKLSAVRGTLSPDGRIIAWEMGYNHEANGSSCWLVTGLRVHEAATEKLLYRKNAKPELSLLVGFSKDSKHLKCYCQDKLRVWETASGKELAALEVPKSEGSGLLSNGDTEDLLNTPDFVLSPDGRHAVISEWGSRLRLWDLQTGKPTRDISPGFVRSRHYRFSGSQVFSSDGQILLATTETTLCLFDTRNGKHRAGSGHHASITPRFAADGRTLFTSCDEKRNHWDVSGKSPTLLKCAPRNPWVIECLEHSTDDRFFLDIAKNRVRVRETATGRILRELSWDRFPDAARFSPDASRVLLWSDSQEGDRQSRMKVHLYDVNTGEAAKTFKPLALVGAPIFSPNGRRIAWADNNNAVHMYDVRAGKTVRTLRSSRSLASSTCDDAHLLFSPDGEQLIVTTYLYGKGNVESYRSLPTRVFAFSSGREIARFHANPKEGNKAAMLSCLTCSPDGHLLAVSESGSGIVRLIEIASGKVRAEFAGHRHGVHGLAFAPDGKTLASGGEDNVVFLWDVTGARTSAAKPPRDSDLTSLWNDLASEDGRLRRHRHHFFAAQAGGQRGVPPRATASGRGDGQKAFGPADRQSRRCCFRDARSRQPRADSTRRTRRSHVAARVEESSVAGSETAH